MSPWLLSSSILYVTSANQSQVPDQGSPVSGEAVPFRMACFGARHSSGGVCQTRKASHLSFRLSVACASVLTSPSSILAWALLLSGSPISSAELEARQVLRGGQSFGRGKDGARYKAPCSESLRFTDTRKARAKTRKPRETKLLPDFEGKMARR